MILFSFFVVRLLNRDARQRWILWILLCLVLAATAFEVDTTERHGSVVPGVVPTAGEKRQCAAGHDNDAPDANCNAA